MGRHSRQVCFFLCWNKSIFPKCFQACMQNKDIQYCNCSGLYVLQNINLRIYINSADWPGRLLRYTRIFEIDFLLFIVLVSLNKKSKHLPCIVLVLLQSYLTQTVHSLVDSLHRNVHSVQYKRHKVHKQEELQGCWVHQGQSRKHSAR